MSSITVDIKTEKKITATLIKKLSSFFTNDILKIIEDYSELDIELVEFSIEKSTIFFEFFGYADHDFLCCVLGDLSSLLGKDINAEVFYSATGDNEWGHVSDSKLEWFDELEELELKLKNKRSSNEPADISEVKLGLVFQAKYSSKKLTDQVLAVLKLITKEYISQNGKEESIEEFQKAFTPIVRKTLPVIDNVESFVHDNVNNPAFTPLDKVFIDNGILTIHINCKINQLWLFPEFMIMLALNSKKYRGIYRDKYDDHIFIRLTGLLQCIPIMDERLQQDLHVNW